MKHVVYLLVGSNIEREVCFPAAYPLLASLGEVRVVSPVYETIPVRMPGAPDFFNGALLVATDDAPEVFKHRLVTEVEEPLGRHRTGQGPCRPRTIDVDIALWDSFIGEIAGRPVPDPDILTCLHVARPLADIAPDLVHPVTGETLAGIADRLSLTCPLPRVRPDVILDV